MGIHVVFIFHLLQERQHFMQVIIDIQTQMQLEIQRYLFLFQPSI